MPGSVLPGRARSAEGSAFFCKGACVWPCFWSSWERDSLRGCARDDFAASFAAVAASSASISISTSHNSTRLREGTSTNRTPARWPPSVHSTTPPNRKAIPWMRKATSTRVLTPAENVPGVRNRHPSTLSSIIRPAMHDPWLSSRSVALSSTTYRGRARRSGTPAA